MSTAIEEIEVKKTAGKVQKPAAQNVAEAPAKGINPLEELRKQAEMAYNSYQGAQRKVASAYRQREQEEVKAYKFIEQEANDGCDEAIRKALAVRVESERNARDAYEKALEKAGKVYEGTVAESLKVSRNKIEQQWLVTREFSDQIWNIFQGDGAK